MKFASMSIVAFALLLCFAVSVNGQEIPRGSLAVTLAQEGQPQKLAEDAEPGDIVEIMTRVEYAEATVYLVASLDAGEHNVDWSSYALLSVESISARATMTTSLEIPAGTEGNRYVLQVLAVLPSGELVGSHTAQLSIRPQHPAQMGVLRLGSFDTADHSTFTTGQVLSAWAGSNYDAGDLILLASAPHPVTGGLDISAFVALGMVSHDTPGASTSFLFRVPAGFTGDVVIQAIAFSSDGRVSFSHADLLKFR